MGDNDTQSISDESESSEEKWLLSRRSALKGVGAATLAIPLSSLALDEAEAGDLEYAPRVNQVNEDAFQEFTWDQALMVEALSAHIFPSDENGPGAPEAGVVFFIDHQLAAGWGAGDKHYMEGPFYPEEAVPEQGWQYRLTPSEVYEHALDALDEHVQAEYEDDLANLSDEDLDAVIEALAGDEIDTFSGIAPSDFFAMLRRNVLEGMYADPAYGGNRDMVGWELKQFPGSPSSFISYREEIEGEEFIEVPPRSLEQVVQEEEPGELVLDSHVGPDAGHGNETAEGEVDNDTDDAGDEEAEPTEQPPDEEDEPEEEEPSEGDEVP